MKNLLLSSALAAGIISLGACATAQENVVHSNQNQPSHRTAVLETISSFFKAMEFKDVETTNEIILPGGRYFSTEQQAAGYEIMTTEDYLQSLGEEGAPLLQERLINPDVRIRGNIASVWSEYQFFVGQEFSHCGVDVFDFVKTDDGWRMVSSVFTVEDGAACEAGRDKYGAWIDGGYVIE